YAPSLSCKGFFQRTTPIGERSRSLAAGLRLTLKLFSGSKLLRVNTLMIRHGKTHFAGAQNAFFLKPCPLSPLMIMVSAIIAEPTVRSPTRAKRHCARLSGLFVEQTVHRSV